MGMCIYCGKDAGWFKTAHEQCESKHSSCLEDISRRATDAIVSGGSLDDLKTSTEQIAKDCFVADAEYRNAVITAWEMAAKHFLDDGNLDRDEESRIVEYQRAFAIDENDANRSGYLMQLAKAGILRDVAEGKTPTRAEFAGDFRFKLEKIETPIFAFHNVSYYELKTRRHIEGVSHGVSLRIAEGVYYRVGEFKGYPVETSQNVLIDTGTMLITDRNLYFGGPVKSQKLGYLKVLSLIPFSDGVGVQMNTASATTKTFVTGDGWFTYNLLANLCGIG
jgi:hypothetical protein